MGGGCGLPAWVAPCPRPERRPPRPRPPPHHAGRVVRGHGALQAVRAGEDEEAALGRRPQLLQQVGLGGPVPGAEGLHDHALHGRLQEGPNLRRGADAVRAFASRCRTHRPERGHKEPRPRGAREAAPRCACFVPKAEAGVGTTRTRWEGSRGGRGERPAARLCPPPSHPSTLSRVPGRLWLPVSGESLAGDTLQPSWFRCKPGTSPPHPTRPEVPTRKTDKWGRGSTWHRSPSPSTALPISAGLSAGRQGYGTSSVALCPPAAPALATARSGNLLSDRAGRDPAGPGGTCGAQPHVTRRPRAVTATSVRPASWARTWPVVRGLCTGSLCSHPVTSVGSWEDPTCRTSPAAARARGPLSQGLSSVPSRTHPLP